MDEQNDYINTICLLETLSQELNSLGLSSIYPNIQVKKNKYKNCMKKVSYNDAISDLCIQISDTQLISASDTQKSDIQIKSISDTQKSDIQLISTSDTETSDTQIKSIGDTETSDTQIVSVSDTETSDTQFVSVSDTETSDTQIKSIGDTETSDTQIVSASDIYKSISRKENRNKKILEYCYCKKSASEIRKFLNISSKRYVAYEIIKPLILDGRLERTNKNCINARNQKYITVKKKGEC